MQEAGEKFEGKWGLDPCQSFSGRSLPGRAGRPSDLTASKFPEGFMLKGVLDPRVSLGKTQDDGTSGILLAASTIGMGDTHNEEHQYTLVGSGLVLASKAFCPFDTTKIKSRK